jgi:hypothetical protein
MRKRIRQQAILEAQASRIGRESFLSGDFKDFNFFHLEFRRTREKCLPFQSSVVRVSVTGPIIKEGVTVGICIAVLANTHVKEVWTGEGITHDRLVLHFGPQPKSSRWDVPRIFQREKETLQTRVGLTATVGIPFHRSESPKGVPVRIQNQSQSVRMPVAAVVKIRVNLFQRFTQTCQHFDVWFPGGYLVREVMSFCSNLDSGVEIAT